MTTGNDTWLSDIHVRLRRDHRVEHGEATTAGYVHQHPIGGVSSAAELLDLLALVRPDLSRLDQDLTAISANWGRRWPGRAARRSGCGR